MSVLSQGGKGEEINRDGLGRGRARGRGWGRCGGRRRGGDRMRRMEMDDMDEGFSAGLYLGDNANGEKMAEKVGVDNMNTLIEAFEEMSSRVLPCPMEKAYVDAMHTNYMSNPGWRFDKKCQFMDKLVWEASQQYKKCFWHGRRIGTFNYLAGMHKD